MRIVRKPFSMILLFSMCLTGSLPPISNAATQSYDMAYLYYGNPASWPQLVKNTNGALNEVDPNYMEVSSTGDLQMTSAFQPDFISQMHQEGIKVVPYITSNFNRTVGAAAMNNRKKLAEEISNAIQQDNFDGVDVDIEGLDQTYRDQYTDFVSQLRADLGPSKEVTVAVAANPDGSTTGWNGCYNYNALAQQSDYLMVMTYDESYEGSQEGPVASIPFVEKSIEYALHQGVPNAKLILGVPFYGRLWKTDSPTLSNVTTIKGAAVSMFREQSLLHTFNASISFDTPSETEKATFSIPQGKTYSLGNTTLTAGTYDLWYDDQKSIEAKLALVEKYHLKGVGSWSLSQESPDTWSYFSSALNGINQPNGQYFTDVPSGYWAQDAILAMAHKGWMNGIGSNQFGPANSLTRAQGAAILVRALGLGQVTPTSYVFQDIPSTDDWAKQNIEVAREYGIVNGTSSTIFDPDAPLTREQLSVMLANIFKLKAQHPENNPFTDVDPSRTWSYDAIVAMKENSIISGFGDGTFHPNDVAQRAQMAEFMYRLTPQFQAKLGTIQFVTQ